MSGAGLLLAAALGASGPAVETPTVAVVARPDGQTVEPRRLGTHYLRLDETVELAAVVVSADDRRAPPPDTEARLRWFEARPEARDYDNVRRCHGRPRDDCADPIAYRVVEIARWRGRARISVRGADVGLGTHRYAVTVGAAPAAAAGAIAGWAAIVVRRDDTYTGYLTELVGTPFVFWPTGRQVDERLGADCVALVIYGRRRLGHRVPYVSPRGLAKLTARVAAGRFPADPSRGSPTPVPIQVGDVVHFGFQTAVVVEDRPPRGVLTAHDVIIHSYHGVAEEVPLGQVPYAHFPFEVRRWPR